MWHKLVAAAIIIIVIIFAIPAYAAADTSYASAEMTGQAQIIRGLHATEIRMELSSAGEPGWSISLDLSIPVPQNSGDDEERDGDREVEEVDYRANPVVTTYDARGNYTLGAGGQILSSGTAAGTLNAGGNGQITLLGQGESASLNISFTIFNSGTVRAAAEGQWPLISSPAPTTTTTAAAPVVTVPASPPPVNTVPVAPVTTITLPAAEQPSAPAPVQQSNSHFFWYVSRTSAMLAYILLFINICLGIGLKTKTLEPLVRRWRTFDLHQFTSILGGALILLHVFSLLGDAYFNFSVSQLLVPMASPYRPLWTALGSIALYAGAVIALSSFIRKLIGQNLWRVLHFLSYALFFVILAHGIMAGTDSSTVWVKWMYVSTGAVTAFLFLWRFLIYRDRPESIADKAAVEPHA
jgi:methionine sulfoxide reductase heme-binding subunit